MRFPAPIAAPLIAAGLACAAVGQSAHAATLTVALNHSARLPVGGRAASVVVGNAAVADVTVVDSHTLFVTGKAPGTTDVAVIDPLGRTVYATDIEVSVGAGRSVTIHRAGERAELSCDPRCNTLTSSTPSAPPAAAALAANSASSAAGMAPPPGLLSGAMGAATAVQPMPPVGILAPG